MRRAVALSMVAHVVMGAALARLARHDDVRPAASRPTTVEVRIIDRAPPVADAAPGAVRPAEPPPRPATATVRAARGPRDLASESATVREREAAAELERETAAERESDAARPAEPDDRAHLGDPRIVGDAPSAPPELDLVLRADPTGPRTRSSAGGSDERAPPTIASLPRPLQSSAGGSYVYEERGFTAEIDHDGTVHFRDHTPVGFTSPVSLAFDLTEAVMLLRGDDPYRPEKVRFLDATRELRAKLCGAAHTERLRRAVVALPRELERLWADEGRSHAERRRLLFERWDECAPPGDESEAARAGAMARATVLAFIRRTIPRGSPHGYTDAELVALNARRVSAEHFAP